MIGADLRNPQLHRVLNIDRESTSNGLSKILSNSKMEIDKEQIQKFDIFGNNLDVIFSGVIPPNPAELLNSKNFSMFLDDLKSTYDFIIIDSAPLLLVSDTFPLLKQSDLTLITLRSGQTERVISSFVNELVESKKVNECAIILNGVKFGSKSYYKYGYSYRYSYQYKYNYGYGYGYGEDKS